MSTLPVEAVFFWRYGKAPFAAAYGRFSGSKYTKDYLQAPANQKQLIDQVLGAPTTSQPQIPIQFRWPGGSREGNWRHSAVPDDNRGQLAWINDRAPPPWRVGDPATDPAIAIPGDSSKSNEADADAVYGDLESKNLDPWIVAVKAKGVERVLFPRAYLGSPPPGLEGRALAVLPKILQQEIERLPGNLGGGGLIFQDGLSLRATELVHQILDALKRGPNILLVGPPGTGKTVALEDIRLLVNQPNIIGFDPDKWEDCWSEMKISDATARKVTSVVFHPSYSYENFVAGLVPKSSPDGMKLVARPGPLLCLAHWAQEPSREAFLLIDEFNRGPAASIFGDTLALLDGDKRSDPKKSCPGAVIQRAFADEPMSVGTDFAHSDGKTELDTLLTLPSSLKIIAALNSTDRSVAPLDAALRRRFSMIYVGPDYSLLASRLGVNQGPFSPSAPDLADWTANDVKGLALNILKALNSRIELVLGQDFVLGHALLWDVEGATRNDTIASFANAFDERIAASLRFTFVDQDEALAAILNAGPPPTNSLRSQPDDLIAHWKAPPDAMAAVSTARLELRPLSKMPHDIALMALARLQ